MRKVENHPIEAPRSTEFLASSRGRMAQLRCVDAMKDSLLCDLEVLDVGSSLGVFFQEDGEGIVAGCCEGGAGVVG